MRREMVTVKPINTAEYAIAKAPSNKVDTLIVVEGGNIVGICTTNDFFHKIINPTLGIGKVGTRVFIEGAGDGKPTEEIIGTFNWMSIRTNVNWRSCSSKAAQNDLTLHLEVDDATEVIKALARQGYTATVRNMRGLA